MKIESSFTVPAQPEAAYRFLLDLRRVAPCIPGGTLGEPDGDGVYPASVIVKLGPMRLSYDGTIEIAESDRETRRATISARAREKRGNGTVRSTMAMQITPEGSGSSVAVATELELTGRAAQMGRGIVEDVAQRLVGEMATCLAARLSIGSDGVAPGMHEAAAPAKGDPAARPLSVPALVGHLLRSRLRALLRRGGGRT